MRDAEAPPHTDTANRNAKPSEKHAERDPAADLRGILPPVKEKHHAALTNPKALGELLRAIDGYRGSFVSGAEPGLLCGLPSVQTPLFRPVACRLD